MLEDLAGNLWQLRWWLLFWFVFLNLLGYAVMKFRARKTKKKGGYLRFL